MAAESPPARSAGTDAQHAVDLLVGVAEALRNEAASTLDPVARLSIGLLAQMTETTITGIER